MGAKVSVVNQTPYAWYYESQDRRGYKRINAGCKTTYDDQKYVCRNIYIRYENHTWDSFRYWFNSYKGDAIFTLMETYDRSQIKLSCSIESGINHCPNYGKIAEDEKQRQQQEEARRLERLEREQRIQQELDRESESSRQKLSRATERLREKQSFRGHEQHHERTQALHQQIEDDAAAIERDEVTDVEQKFKELLLKHQITEDRDIQNYQIWDRIKTLQNEFTAQYCKEKNLSLWSQFTFDDAVGYNELSLTEQLTVLEASLQFILYSSTEDAEDDGDQPLGWEKKYGFLLGLVEQLNTINSTLAERILLNVLDMISEISPQSKVILGQMLFNRIWTPTEIMLFICKSPEIKCDLLDSVLHTAQTYHLNCILVLSALMNENPLMFLQEQIRNDKEKDADTIVKELREANCPEKVLVVLKDVLRYMESELPKYELVDLTKEQMNDLKNKIKSLNLANPDIKILKDVLIGMSIAVQDCSTIITKDNKKIQGYFPRRTQLASLLLLLLAQLTENKGCLLEIGTGEGKSCILGMFATILAIRGTKVDIVTSSPILAQRDQEEWKKFFEMFGVTSSVVPPRYSSAQSPEEQEEVLRNAYRQQIVYGTVGVFAADILKQEFEKRTTRDKRPFELVIVDEVDYMTLDNGVQVTFLSHEAGGFRHVEQVLSNIWAMISSCQPVEMFETGEIKWATRIQYFHKAVTAAIMGQETSDSFSVNEILLPGVTLGFYTQQDVEMINQAQSKKENEGQDAMSTALSEIMKKLGVTQQFDLVSIFEEVLENSAVFKCYSLENKKAKRFENREKKGDFNVEMLLLEGGLACEIMSEKSLIDATVSAIKSSIKYSNNLQTAKEANNFIVIPVFLKYYVENQLPVFVENALKAVEMSRGREYMIDASSAAERDATASNDKHMYNAVIPVDFKASGVLEKNKKWGSGLQQFLEFKHQLAISSISNVTNYMSNFHFFKRYLGGSGIFGVSGTLGGKADRDFLERHYKAKSYNVPEHRHKRMVELPVIQVKGGNHQWIQTICETTWKVAERGQVVLVICEDVKTADELHGKIQDGGRVKAEQITLYTISEKHNIEREKFCGGRIIIATNLGGRGTDIKVDESVNKRGGLFVLLTHFPHNRRVEKQIFGRTSRKGNPGMVQMVVNCDHLAPAYQSQSVEIMRQLREHYEIKRILNMESDELVEINLKENLFSTFCRLLKDFDGHYTQEEKLDPMRMKLEKIPDCFKRHQTKFDYQPAINALKESWALWLTLHEDHINRHDDFSQLETDLIKTIKRTSEMLLRGESDNFYDHVRQAIVRTDLHCRNKSSNSNGAESYWQKVINSDPHYKAVALYNQAYITINLGKGNYKADAMKLLGDAKKSIDVYISEVSNTMVSCNLSVTGNKDQNTDNNNFQSQMEVRMNIFKSWMTYIDNAILKLKELEKSKDDAITEESSVYMLSEEKNFIITNELMSLYDYGLGIVFEVKKKPKFCIDALICFLLGLVQVLAGILICVLTVGTASQFGMGLIGEGVSDMISGIEGMVKGTFDWVSWAISKSISIGLSLITAGFSLIKKAVTSVCKVTKSLLTGTKSFSAVASEFIKSGKAAFTSFKGSVQSGLSSLSKESFKSAMKNMTSSAALRESFKHTAKYTIQEIGKKCVITAMNYAIDVTLQEVFKQILQNSLKNFVTSSVKQNSKLDQTLVEFVSSGAPKAALKKENFKIDQKFEQEIKKSVSMLCEEITPQLILDCTKAQEVISRLTEVCNAATELMEKAKLSGVLETAKLLLRVTESSTRLCQILGAIPTKEIIDQKFVPQLMQSVNELQTEMTKYDHDGRHNLNDVKRLKGELLQEIAQKVSEQFIKSCCEHMTSLMTCTFKNELNIAAGKAVEKIMRRNKTQRFFDDQREKHNNSSASHKEVQQLSEEDKTKLKQYTEDMCKADQPTTALDVYVLTKSKLLDGKGIHITIVDENGKQLTEERHPGTNKSAGDLKLRLTKSAKDQPPSQAGSQLYSGRFDILQDDGEMISKISINSNDQNALYQAVVQATGTKTKDPKKEALMLREKVKNEIQTNLESYTSLLILQREYDLSNKTPKKYSLTGGSKKETNTALQEYFQSVKIIKSDERILIKMYHLGFVGKHTSVVSARRLSVNVIGALNTSHIPPKDSIRLAQMFLENPKSASEFKKKSPELYKLISSIKSDNNGQNLIAMEVLGQDHIQALTTGPSSRSQMARKLLGDTMISGDVELLVKRCIILHHPLTSQKLRSALGESIQSQFPVLSDNGIQSYYKAGYKNLVSEYSRMGILDQNQRERLDKWVSQDQHEDTDTAEYRQVLEELKKGELK